jgi:hypothetical protein
MRQIEAANTNQGFVHRDLYIVALLSVAKYLNTDILPFSIRPTILSLLFPPPYSFLKPFFLIRRFAGSNQRFNNGLQVQSGS